jgi:ferredoxin
MAFVITQKCVGEVYASCVEVCPVDCIHYVDKIPDGYPDTGKAFMVIDPETCVDCEACAPECPVDAIISDPDEDPQWAKVNAELSPKFEGEKTEARDTSEAPKREDNTLRS